MASALAKLHRNVQQIPIQRGNPAHSHLFIVNPFAGGFQSLFSTPPSVKEGVRRLQEMAVGEME